MFVFVLQSLYKLPAGFSWTWHRRASGQSFDLWTITRKVARKWTSIANFDFLLETTYSFLNSLAELEKSVQQIITTWRNPN